MYPVEHIHIIISDIENIDKLIEHPRILVKNIRRESLWYSSDYNPNNTEYVSFLNSKDSAYCNIECYITIKHMRKFKRLLSGSTTKLLTTTTADVLEIIN